MVTVNKIWGMDVVVWFLGVLSDIVAFPFHEVLDTTLAEMTVPDILNCVFLYSVD